MRGYLSIAALLAVAFAGAASAPVPVLAAPEKVGCGVTDSGPGEAPAGVSPAGGARGGSAAPT